ncbi:YheC/YheD family protein [Baia soyae]|uniref:Glutathione synthase/RimK-type ligase-like ATP-grasp enzyme n=1 Tax=Baia soyae TaxID=1544746 RepID=A0A4R2RZN9_9BACL|nr:YheC/YheD family protein [Baia soyae]TCP68367.1 glutathione synthase/RimK-type ligase-like ATP-grasp enzyme [Baia soyae]
MGQAKIQIQVLHERHFPAHINMVLSQTLAEKLGIQGSPFRISFGSATETGYASIRQSNNPVLRISSKLAAHLRIENETTISAYFDNITRRLKIGPLLGILINSHPKEGTDSPFGEITKFLDECVQAGDSHGLRIAVISPDLIHLESRSIQGYVKDQSKWKRVSLPLPDVIYNRITSRRIERTESVQKMVEHLKNSCSIPFFNDRFLNKMQVHQLLIQDEDAVEMLPETHYLSIETLKNMTKKYPILYLKPTNGSLGDGIIRVTRKDDKWIAQSSVQNGTTTSHTAQTFTELNHILRTKVKKRAYLVQQGLQLVRFQNRALDFRILVQKNKTGEWAVTSSIARIAGDQQIVSNVAKGGTLRRVKDILAELGDLPNKLTSAHIRSVAKSIAASFENQVDGHFAELGIDLALDQNGRLWLIEINSKPSKTDDTVHNPTLSARPSVVRLMEYTIHLTSEHTRNRHSHPPHQGYLQSISKRRKPR